MKTFLSCILISASALVLTSCSSTPDEKGSEATTIRLFNGTDLEGWDYILASNVPPTQVFKVENGLLTAMGSPVGAICKGPNVTNFKLVVEYRWPAGGKPGNSGIFSRVTTPLSKSIPQAIEVQLAHGSAGDIMGLQGQKIGAGQPRFFAIQKHPLAGDIAGVKKMVDAEKAQGEWNRVEIEARGPHYTVHMNGVLVNEANEVEVKAGPIGLQSEEGVVQFRKVELTPLE